MKGGTVILERLKCQSVSKLARSWLEAGSNVIKIYTISSLSGELMTSEAGRLVADSGFFLILEAFDCDIKSTYV